MALRVVVDGAGARGRDWAREASRHSAFELAGVVDVDPGRLERAGRDHAAPGFATLPEALESAPCDAVVVATPPADHAAACRAALEGGAAVLVEKPFAERLAEAAELVDLADELGRPLLVAQNYRYMRAHRTVRRLVREGALGRVRSVVAQYYRVPHVDEYRRESILSGPGVHHLDALRWVLGQDAVGVMARYDGKSVEALVELDGGTRATYVATYEARGHEFFEGGQEFYERLIGERATLHVFQRWLFLCEGRKLPRPIRRGSRPVSEESILLTQLERALLHGEAPDASGRANLGTVAMVEACMRSAEEGRRVEPGELLDVAG